ncbi:MAG: 16S rRNA (cytidine(1402)-2'-O)-methyltransferase [Betaproteobacteria bacterium]|nr:16S rRNA (cytidine(1402)-2'-O)-methyltransferase [Betaproteobacteria bacterium]
MNPGHEEAAGKAGGTAGGAVDADSRGDGLGSGTGNAHGGRLYVVATPIGNLEDITLRALSVLGTVDVIAAEDTRNTARLLDRHGIGTRMLSLHEHNEARRAQEILRLLEAGRQVALVSDAGTPALSDPGAILVARLRAAGHAVIPIPGPSAATAALSVAGLAGTAFHFSGFLPERAAARRAAIAALAAEEALLVFYESPHRVLACVEDLAAVLGAGGPQDAPPREIVIARELTKLFESVHRCPLAEAAAWLAADPSRVRGEFVLLVTGAPKATGGSTGADLDRVLKALLAELPLAQSVKLARSITGLRRGEVYARALELTGKAPAAKA